MRAVARQPTDVVPVIVLDLPLPPGPPAAYCDAAARTALAAMGADSALTRRVLGQPRSDRPATLLDAGLLPAYHATLERLVARQAGAVRSELRRRSPGLVFGVRAAAAPGDWLGVGLLRGLGDRQAPVLLFTPEPRPAELLARYRARGVHARHVMGIDPGHVPPAAWRRLGSVMRAEHEGFWLALGAGVPRETTVPGGAEPISPDSLARLVRRLARDR
jgi:hypothetical protein